MTTVNYPASQAVAALEDRAAQRLKAAERLQVLCDQERSGLVKEELQKGIRTMLIQQVEFLLAADKLRKQVASVGAQGRLL